MMKMKKYNDYDTLTLYVKKLKASEIIDSYKTFGWVLTSEVENSKYEDIVDLSFERPHKIENKDELQLMQVYMEEKLNNIGKLEIHKHSRSSAFGLFFGIIGLFLMIFGSILCFDFLLPKELILGIVLLSVGFIFGVITAICLPKIIKFENKHYEEIYAKLEDELTSICKKAEYLYGGKNHE